MGVKGVNRWLTEASCTETTLRTFNSLAAEVDSSCGAPWVKQAMQLRFYLVFLAGLVFLALATNFSAEC